MSLANRGEQVVGVYFAAETPSGRHHDFLTVELTAEQGQRILRFAGDRNASTIGYVDLAPGQEVADELDLARWATEPINGAKRLARGEHELIATYRVHQQGVWNGSITAGPVRLVNR